MSSKHHAVLTGWRSVARGPTVDFSPDDPAHQILSEYYKAELAPKVNRFVTHQLLKLRKKGMSVNYILKIDTGSSRVQIFLVPTLGMAEVALNIEPMIQAIGLARDMLDSHPADLPAITKIFLDFDAPGGAYCLRRAECADGSVLRSEAAMALIFDGHRARLDCRMTQRRVATLRQRNAKPSALPPKSGRIAAPT